MAHLWLCAPFLIVWFSEPGVRTSLPYGSFSKLQVFVSIVCVYLLARTYLAFKDPPWLRWDYWFPPIDVLIVSSLIRLGDQEPLSNVSLLYFFPLAEAAGTLSVAWAATIAAWVFASCALATNGFITSDPFAAWFRYFFIGVMASLFTWLARANADIREQLGVARDRNRIALEMHDGVQGHLMTIASRLELAQRLAQKNPDRAAEIAGESRETARLAADELRFLVQRLRAPGLREGFLPALKQFAHNQCERNGLAYHFEVAGEPFALSAEAENALFRSAQEAMTNILRHAHASEVEVRVTFTPDEVRLNVVDNGVGFDLSSANHQQEQHAGLEGMTSRAEALAGRMILTTAPESGVEVTIEIPRSRAELREVSQLA